MPVGKYYKNKDMIEKTKRSYKNAVCHSLRQGSSTIKACQEAGIDRSSFYRWLEHDVHFRQAVAFAKKARVNIVEDALFRTAVEGDVTAQKFFLTNRDPENWKDKGTLVNNGLIQTGNENATMPIQINFIGVKPERQVAEAEVLQDHQSGVTGQSDAGFTAEGEAI